MVAAVPSDFALLSLCELTAALREKRLSAVELMRATLDRVDATRERLNAVPVTADRSDLLEQAHAADARLSSGQARPLEGVPLGVKDLEDARGLATSHGSLPYRDRVAELDSTQVARLKHAGAIVVGKTNAPEFGHTAITRNLVYGVTRSPWNAERTPGGSSGGSAAALTGGVLPLVTASDGGGSIRIPGSFVGAFGLKTTYGRIPGGPLHRWSHIMTAVQGPLTKTVADAALFLDQVVGHDATDPSSLPHPGISYSSVLASALPKRLRIAFSPDFGHVPVQADIASVVEEAARTFEKLGHELVALPGGPPDLTAAWGLMNALEVGGLMQEFRPAREKDFTQSLLGVVRMAEAMTGPFWNDVALKRAELVRWCAELFADYDLLVTPTVPFDPPPAKGPFPQEIEGRTMPTASVAAFCIPFNMSWHPAATVRAGMSRAGLPIGLQIVAPLQREDLLLQIAYAYERERPWHPDWPR
ncbi:MAG TPA: amidase [Polyangiaceae bacterium]|nr:amidase [Polyangiaceae bacterium]